jgi:hypothetical protein
MITGRCECDKVRYQVDGELKVLAADNRQLAVPELGSILASGLCGMALTVSAVCCS